MLGPSYTCHQCCTKTHLTGGDKAADTTPASCCFLWLVQLPTVGGWGWRFLSEAAGLVTMDELQQSLKQRSLADHKVSWEFVAIQSPHWVCVEQSRLQLLLPNRWHCGCRYHVGWCRRPHFDLYINRPELWVQWNSRGCISTCRDHWPFIFSTSYQEVSSRSKQRLSGMKTCIIRQERKGYGTLSGAVLGWWQSDRKRQILICPFSKAELWVRAAVASLPKDSLLESFTKWRQTLERQGKGHHPLC